ncbi:tetratricopeptide repeat protein [Streptomyces sp. NPDC004561]
MSTGFVRIPGFVSDMPGVEEMPDAVRRLAVLLSVATRIEPELIRAVRVGIRPGLDVGAESALWFGAWAHRNSAEYMAFRPSLLAPLREALREELQASGDGDAVRQTGDIVFRMHHGLSPVLALEEQVTWAAVLADAGLGGAEANTDQQSEVDRLLERVLRAAVEAPERREGLRRWFTGAWHRFPDRVRQTPTALELFQVLALAERRLSAPARAAVPEGVEDVALPVRHDGAYITVGEPGWPAESILVPDTQPRVLEVTGDLSAWETAQKIRVPRSGQVRLAVAHVPVYLRTGRGHVYQVGAPHSFDAAGYPARVAAGSRDRGLLGGRVSNLRDGDAVRFGVRPLIMRRAGTRPSDYRHPQHEVRCDPVPYSAHAADTRLGAALRRASAASCLLVVEGEPASGRTRTTWEAMRQALPHWWVWCPRLLGRAETLIDAVVQDELGADTVVWLDDLDLLLSDPVKGEQVADALEKLLTDPACRPVLLLATSAPGAKNRSEMGERALALLSRAVPFTLSEPPLSSRPFLGTGPLVSAITSAQPQYRVFPEEQLPPLLASFCGRTTELAQLFSVLGDAAPSAFAVVAGFSGTGKSALARKAVSEARARGWFTGGVLWMDLVGQPFTPARLLSRLGIDKEAQPADEAGRWAVCSSLLHQLTDAGQLPVLIVVDNASSWEFDDLPSLAPGISVLVTSRGVGGGGPRSVQPLVLGPLTDSEAIQVLAMELKRRGPDDAAVSSQDLRRLAKACGGLPLALTIAAAQLANGRRVRDLADALERWPADSTVLAGGGQSVGAALQWSVARLTPVQKRAFRLLSLHPTSAFSSAAAAAVLGRSPDRILRRLAQAHLLQYESHERRWRMHDLIMRYARSLGEAHAVDDEREEAFDRLMEHYLQHAEAADAWLREENPSTASPFASRKQALAWMVGERASLVAAVDRCLETGRHRWAASIALALAEFLTGGQHFEDLLHVMRAVLESSAPTADDRYTRAAALNNFALAMGKTGNFSEAMSALKRAAELHHKLREGHSAYIVMLRNLASTLLVSNRPQDAVVALYRAAESCQGPADVAVRAQVLGQLGIALLEAEEPQQAIAPLRETLDLLAQTDAPVLDRAMLYGRLGTALARSGERGEARAILAEAAELCNRDESGDQPRRAAVRETLGRAMLESGLFTPAALLLGEAAADYRELENLRSAARAHNDQGLALLETGNGYDALHALEEAQYLYLHLGDEVRAAQCNNNVGKVLRRLGQHAAAIEALTPTAQALMQAGDEAGAAEALLNLGLAQLAEGLTGHAQESLSASADLHGAVGNLTSRAHALLGLGRAALSADDPHAIDHLQLAIEAFRQAPSSDGKIDALLLLSDVLDMSGRKEEARAALREALESEEQPGAEGAGTPLTR